MTAPDQRAAELELITALRSARAQLEAAERVVEAVRAYRDRVIVELAQLGVLHAYIGENAGVAQQRVSLIARSNDQRRYRPREP